MTQEEREEMRRHFGVLTEDLRSQLQQVAEGVTAHGEALDRFRAETGSNFADVGRQFVAVRSGAEAFRVETARNFAAVHTEFAAVRSEAEAFRDETARNFAAVRSEMAGSRTGLPLPRRPRTRRRPN